MPELPQAPPSSPASPPSPPASPPSPPTPRGSPPAGRITLGLVSDTHGWVHPFLHEAFAGVTAILHAGDVGAVDVHAADTGAKDVLTELSSIAPTLAVRGNIDGGALGDLPPYLVEAFADYRVAVVHVAGSPKRPSQEARSLLERAHPDVLVYGHSHLPALYRVPGTLWLNPGAAGRYGIHKQRTAVRLHLDPGGQICFDLVKLGGRTDPG